MRWRLHQRPGKSQARRRLQIEKLEARCLLAAVYGITFSDLNRNGLKEESIGEQVLGGIEMRLLNSSGSQVGIAHSDPTGLFKFEGLAAGRYTLTEAPGNQPTSQNFPLSLTLAADEAAVPSLSYAFGSTEPKKVENASLFVGNVPRTNMAFERTQFSASTGQIVFQNETTWETVSLTGSGEIVVLFEGAQTGDAVDDNGDGYDEVAAQLVQLQLTGTSSTGPVLVAVDPTQPASGVITEQTNGQSGRLDVPPFTAAGSATVALEAGATVRIGTETYRLATPLQFTATVTREPAATGETYMHSSAVALFTEAGQATGRTVAAVRWTPLPTAVWQNPRSRFDANGDGQLTPADALLLINRINEYGGVIILPSPAQAPFVPPPFWDVNGDGKLSPADVLAVINELNLNGPYTIPFDIMPLATPPAASGGVPVSGGEGEATMVPKTAAATVAPVPAVQTKTARSRLQRPSAKLTVQAVEPALTLLASDVGQVRARRR